MGSGTSRGKKVAPACVDQVTSIETSSKPLQATKIHAILRSARSNCAPPDRLSEGRDSGSSGEDDDGERDAVPERQEWVSARKVTSRKSSKTYGLCHSRRDGEEDSGPEEPPAPRGANRRRDEACPEHQLQVSSSGKRNRCSHSKLAVGFVLNLKDILSSPLSQSSSRGFLTAEVLLRDAAPAHKQP